MARERQEDEREGSHRLTEVAITEAPPKATYVTVQAQDGTMSLPMPMADTANQSWYR